MKGILSVLAAGIFCLSISATVLSSTANARATASSAHDCSGPLKQYAHEPEPVCAYENDNPCSDKYGCPLRKTFIDYIRDLF